MAGDIDQLRLAAENGKIVWRKHMLQRLVERNIHLINVREVTQAGEVIRSYDDDRPFPSLLLLGWIQERPLHVVASYDIIDEIAYVITVYEPSLDIFESDFKSRKQ